MNKRLLCLLLCLIMLMSVAFAGCAKKTDEESTEEITEQASKSTVTLSLYLMSEEEISDEQAQKIEDAANRITKSKFKAKLDIRYFTEEQYNEALEDAFKKTKNEIAAKKAAEQALKEAIKNGKATKAPETSAEVTEEETVITEFGTTELKYPSITDHQIDIFYLEGFDTLMNYIADEKVVAVDEELTGYSKLLADYLVSDYLEYADKITEGTYMIPNAKAIGEYTYLLLKKDVLAKYNYSAKKDSFTSITCENVKDILDKVSKYDAQYVPLWSGTGEFNLSNIAYIGFDSNNSFSHKGFSVIGGTYISSYKYGIVNNIYNCGNIFGSEFNSQMKTLFEYKEKNYYGAENDERKFAVGIVKGDGTLPAQYADEYEVVVIQNPQITTEDVFASGFAVGSNTSDLSRSMEIITYINTNEDFRNLLLYGIEGENYEIVEEKVDGVEYKTAKRLNNDYMMSPERTGNVIISYPLNGEERADIRKYQKIQNRDAEPVLDFGFYYSYQDETINLDAMKYIREFSESVYDKILACETYADYEILINGYTDTENPENNIVGVKQQMTEDPIIKLMLTETYNSQSDNYYDNSELYGEGCSITHLYYKWLLDMGYYNPAA